MGAFHNSHSVTHLNLKLLVSSKELFVSAPFDTLLL